MKIKHDFVTNSSSTAFFFITKSGDENEFKKTLIKYEENFEITHDRSYGQTPEYVSFSIFDILEEMEPFIELRKHPIVVKIEEIDGYIESERKYIEREKLRKEEPYNKWAEEQIQEYQAQQDRFRTAQKDGFTHYYEIGFGDNDGDISGRGVGAAMDYEGRNIEIFADDLIVFTEQRR